MRALLALSVALMPWLAAVACSSQNTGDKIDPAGLPSAAGAAGAGAAGAAGAAGGGAGAMGGPDGGGLEINMPDGNTEQGKTIIFAHTDSTLFQIDPAKLNDGLTLIGDFDCVGGAGQDPAMTDIAVDRDQNLWGVSHTAVHRLAIDGQKVLCQSSITLTDLGDVRFYGLTFAPAGTLDPAKEVLVAGNTAGELWRVDDSGKLTLLGHMGDVPASDGNGNSYDHVGKRWELAGDLVFVENKGAPLGFATVRDCPNPPSTSNCNKTNTLIELDMKKLGKAAPGTMTKAVRGQLVKRQGCADTTDGNYGNMYGIAAWGSRVYGFSRDGFLVDVSLDDGSACLVKPYPDSKFSGAGVTTLAPVEAPPIK